MSYPLCRECQEEGRDGCKVCRPPAKTCTMLVGSLADEKTCDEPASHQMVVNEEPIDEYICPPCFLLMLVSLPTEEARAACRSIWKSVPQ